MHMCSTNISKDNISTGFLAYAFEFTCHLLSVDFSKVLVEEFPNVLVHGGQSLVGYLRSLWGVGVIKGVLDQPDLTSVQVLHLLLTDHDLLEWREQIEERNEAFYDQSV